MATRLLKKSEIDTAKAAERQREIAEGLKIAKRVDGLREVASAEEVALNQFRTNTLAEIGEATKKENAKLEALRVEVSDLEKRRADALEPFDAREAIVVAKEAVADDMLARAEETERRANQRHQSLDQREARVKDKELKVADMHTEVDNLLTSTATLNDDAERKNRQATQLVETLSKERNDLHALQLQKEAEFTEKDDSLKERELALVEDRADLGKREKALRDREALLERNLKRK